MKRFHVRVRNTKSLLMHKFSTEAGAELESKTRKRSTGAPDPKVEAEQGAYRLDPADGDPVWGEDAPAKEMRGTPKGQLCLPAEQFYESMAAASSSFRVQGQGKKTYKEAIRGNLEITPDFVPLVDPRSGHKLHDYSIDSRPVRIQRSRVMRRRPLIAEWAAEFDIIIHDAEEVPDEVLKVILDKAGRSKCVGDYRPRHGGFMLEEFRLVESDEPELESTVPMAVEETEEGEDLDNTGS